MPSIVTPGGRRLSGESATRWIEREARRRTAVSEREGTLRDRQFWRGVRNRARLIENTTGYYGLSESGYRVPETLRNGRQNKEGLSVNQMLFRALRRRAIGRSTG